MTDENSPIGDVEEACYKRKLRGAGRDAGRPSMEEVNHEQYETDEEADDIANLTDAEVEAMLEVEKQKSVEAQRASESRIKRDELRKLVFLNKKPTRRSATPCAEKPTSNAAKVHESRSIDFSMLDLERKARQQLELAMGDDCGQTEDVSKCKSAEKTVKSGRMDNAASKVKYKEEWPHVHLSGLFMTECKGYMELTLAEFVAGYAKILSIAEAGEVAARTNHLEELMYFATIYEWRDVLNYHAAVLNALERGHGKWGEDFAKLQRVTLLTRRMSTQQKQPAGQQRWQSQQHMGPQRWQSQQHTTQQRGQSQQYPRGNPSFAPRDPYEERTFYCKDFNYGNCYKTGDHEAVLGTELRRVKHICSYCWLYLRIKEQHAEKDCTKPRPTHQI